MIITDDVNLRNSAKGEGIMAVPSPSELPKKRKDFLPKMFPDLPEDSAVSHLTLPMLPMMSPPQDIVRIDPSLSAQPQGLTQVHASKRA